MAGPPAPDMTALVNLGSEGTVDLGRPPIVFDGTMQFTFEAWIRPRDIDANATLLFKQNEFVWGLAAGVPYAQRADQQSALKATSELENNTWYFLAVTFDGDVMALYVDGALEACEQMPPGGPASTENDFQVGSKDPQLAFELDIWSLVLWKEPRNCTEEADAVWEGIAYLPGVVAAYDFSQVPPVELGQTYTPSLTSPATSLTAADGIELYGSDWLDPGRTDDLAGSWDGFTVQAWVALNETSGHQCVFTSGDIAGASTVSLWVGNGQLVAQYGQHDQLIGTASLATKDWHNLAMTYDTTTLVLYLDGVQIASQAFEQLSPDSSPKWVLGASDTSGSSGLSGIIQYLSVWTRALSPAEVQAYMYEDETLADGIAANFSFSGGPPAQDLTTTNDVVLGNKAWWAEQLIPVTSWTPPPDVTSIADCLTGLPDVELPEVELNWKVEPLSDEHAEAMLAEARVALGALSDECGVMVEECATESLQEAFRLGRENPEELADRLGFHVGWRLGDEEHALVFRGADGKQQEILRVSAQTSNACVLWWAGFLFTALYGVASLFLPGNVNPSRVTEYIKEKILQNARVMLAFSATVSATFTAASLYQFLKVLYDLGYLKQFFWFVLWSGGRWAVTKALVYIVGRLLVGNAAAVGAWAIQAALLVVQCVVKITGAPGVTGYKQACKSTQAGRPLNAASGLAL